LLDGRDRITKEKYRPVYFEVIKKAENNKDTTTYAHNYINSPICEYFRFLNNIKKSSQPDAKIKKSDGKNSKKNNKILNKNVEQNVSKQTVDSNNDKNRQCPSPQENNSNHSENNNNNNQCFLLPQTIFTDGCNYIFYGVPGCGKSKIIKDEI
jgi:hypothetical protein